MDGSWSKVTLLTAVLAVWVCVGVQGETRARLVSNGYEGVVVAISDSVREQDGPALIQALKDALAKTSRGLYRATDRRAYFRSVRILIPRSWTTVNVTGQASSDSFEESDIRVDAENPVFQHQPYTLQTGGCGDPGQYIHLTPTYLLDDTEASWWGPREKTLLLEWAKLRWGVFDEIGYPGDPNYPPFYKEANNKFSPTHCAHPRTLGLMRDRHDFNSGCGLTSSGLPDEQCVFIPYVSQNVRSSLLSYAAIMSTNIIHFCGGQGREHNPDAPTKQNVLCEKRSAWDVISEHDDFKNGANPPTETFRDMDVQVVQQADTTYALVLDYSGSMSSHDRIHKQRKTARRWILHNVAAGSSVAIIRFSSGAHIVRGLTQITDDSSRTLLADAITANEGGGTSIGSGLRLAVTTVLANALNPVIILITDGQENESPRIGDVLDEVVASGAKVVTIAFGTAADPKLEEVAQKTGGKTFTANDVDEVEMLDNAFQGALTYQPPPPISQQAVKISERNYPATGGVVSSSFVVDSTIGRNLTLRWETKAQVASSPVLTAPDGTTHTATFDSATSAWSIMLPLAQEGQWWWRVTLSGQQAGASVWARVTSLPRDANTLPITTRAWINQGSKGVNAAVDKIIMLAEVKQGTQPVVNAVVRGIVTPPNEHEQEMIYELLDNGQGADTLAGDGIYSRYITKFTSPGRYSVKAQVSDGGQALVNNGFLTSTRRRKRQAADPEIVLDEELLGKLDPTFIRIFLRRPTPCCGSVVPIPPNAPPTSSFERVASGGSIQITSVPTSDVFAPDRVKDLHVELVNRTDDSDPNSFSVIITFTAPGDDLDTGIVSGYELRMTANTSDLQEDNFVIHDSTTNSTWHVVDLNETVTNVEGGIRVTLNVSLVLPSETTYFALRAWDDENNMSKVSNTAVLYVEITPPKKSINWKKPVGTVAVVSVLVMIGVAAYLW